MLREEDGLRAPGCTVGRVASVGCTRLPECSPHPVLHTALQQVFTDGKDVVPDVHAVLDRIKDFSGESQGSVLGRNWEACAGGRES